MVVEFAGDRGDLGSWVLAKNLNRRHMNRDQKCMMAAAMIPYIREVVDADRREKIAETLKKTKSKHNLEDERRFAAHPTDSERTKKKPRAVRTAAIVAAKIGETESRMERNKKLLDHHPELAGSVWRGEMTMAQARKQPGVVKRKEKPKPPEPTERELTLSECEARIEGKLEPFLEATRALFLIRENRLYFEKYGSFDRYLNQRWGVHLRLVQEIQVSVSAPIVAAINESREKEL